MRLPPIPIHLRERSTCVHIRPSIVTGLIGRFFNVTIPRLRGRSRKLTGKSSFPSGVSSADSLLVAALLHVINCVCSPTVRADAKIMLALGPLIAQNCAHIGECGPQPHTASIESKP